MAYTDVEKLAALRVNKKTQNTDVKPVDLLRAAVYALETGEENFNAVMLLTRELKPGGDVQTGSWRCGLTREQELVTLVYAHDNFMNKVRKGQ